MTFASAFQPNAFQNDAFQVFVDPGAAGPGGGYAKKRLPYSEPTEQLAFRKKYEDIVADIDSQLLALAVDPYVRPTNAEENGRRLSALPIFESPPPSERIDFEALLANQIARAKLERIMERLTKRRDEDAFLMLLIGSII